MDILPVQASAVPCERVFSSGKETMTAQRNRISPELMEALRILKFSVKKGRGLNFTEGLSHIEQLQQLEAEMAEDRRVPEDVSSFTTSLVYSVQ